MFAILLILYGCAFRKRIVWVCVGCYIFFPLSSVRTHIPNKTHQKLIHIKIYIHTWKRTNYMDTLFSVLSILYCESPRKRPCGVGCQPICEWVSHGYVYLTCCFLFLLSESLLHVLRLRSLNIIKNVFFIFYLLIFFKKI